MIPNEERKWYPIFYGSFGCQDYNAEMNQRI